MVHREIVDNIDDFDEPTQSSPWLWIIPVILLPVFFFLGWESNAYWNVPANNMQYGVGGAPPIMTGPSVESVTGSSAELTGPSSSSVMTDTPVPSDTSSPTGSSGLQTY